MGPAHTRKEAHGAVTSELGDTQNFTGCVDHLNCDRTCTVYAQMLAFECQRTGCNPPGVNRDKAVESKPRPEDAPSTWGIVGRYVLTPGIFPALEATPPGANGEIQITDAIRRLMDKEPVYACAFEGARYDTGSLVGYLRASVALALQRPELAQPVRDMLAALLADPK